MITVTRELGTVKIVEGEIRTGNYQPIDLCVEETHEEGETHLHIYRMGQEGALYTGLAENWTPNTREGIVQVIMQTA